MMDIFGEVKPKEMQRDKNNHLVCLSISCLHLFNEIFYRDIENGA